MIHYYKECREVNRPRDRLEKVKDERYCEEIG